MSDNDQNIQVKSSGASSGENAGFFTVYRRGQGKWTRLGTAVATGIIILGTAAFIYTDLTAYLRWGQRTGLIITVVFTILAAAVAFYFQNKPSSVVFLIDTDSEMKKVNWTSRKELIGSTKIVIGFMTMLAGMLFVVDILFGYLFYFAGVLKTSPGFFEGVWAMFRQ